MSNQFGSCPWPGHVPGPGIRTTGNYGRTSPAEASVSQLLSETRIDSHQHYWHFDPAQYTWIGERQVLQRDWLPTDLEPLNLASGISGTVAVQARQQPIENDYLLSLANHHEHIVGVVGWLDLTNTDTTNDLTKYAEYSLFKGVRHNPTIEGTVETSARFADNMKAMAQLGLSCDLLAKPTSWPTVLGLAIRFPNNIFVLDHIGNPGLGPDYWKQWKLFVAELGRADNVFCKFSGLVNQGPERHVTDTNVRPWFDHLLRHCGCQRVMFGTDWPVCTVMQSHRAVVELAAGCINSLTTDEQAWVWGRSAAVSYRLPPP
ncbi:MAG: amidohydrolase family protein [Caldilineaceae bacterium SB0665_bin_21]|nr:amidohydrolase family protein [Caldilineaceae bacterium SB0665_bin_21]MYC62255.1 amidohydrolase family protein [Caldilineaceae bacterium SB0661_bin_34]